MKFSGLKRISSKGLNHYQITVYFVVTLFLYTVLVYKLSSATAKFDYEFALRIMLTIVFSTFSSLLIQEVFGEYNKKYWHFSENKGKVVLFALNAISIVFFDFYFYWIDFNTTSELLVFSRVLLMGYTILILFLSVGKTNSRRYGRHLWQSFFSIGVALFFSSVLYLGFSFLALMINLLFELVNVNIYINDHIFWAIVSYVLAFPLLFLSVYADQKVAESNLASRSKSCEEFDFVSRISLFYIVMPLLIVYTVVLYIYFFKQIFLLEFPNNVLAHLINWFLFVSHVALYFISGISSYKNEFEKWVILNSRKLVPSLIIPIILLFFSIAVRICYYGFTESRYYLLLFSVFNTLGLLLIFAFKWRAQFAIIVMSIGMLHISLYGSLSVTNVTYSSQMAVLERILAEEGMDLQEILAGDVDIAEVEFDSEFSQRVESSVDKILETKIPEFKGIEYHALKELKANCNAYIYSAKYYSEGSKFSRNISVYNYNEVLQLSDREHMFRIRQDEEMEIGPFVVCGDSGGIIFFDKDSYERRQQTRRSDTEPEEIYNFDFSSNVIADEASVILYRDEFRCRGTLYEVFFFVEDFNYDVDQERNIVQDGYNHYNFQIIVREKKTE